MISLKDAIETALTNFIERHTGVSAVLKPSKKAHLATNAFLRTDTDAAAKTLSAHAQECTLFDVPLLFDVRSENGWVLFFFTADVIDAYAKQLPEAEEPDDSYFARRLWIAYRHADAETPDDPALLLGFYAVLFSAPDDEQRFLAAPRTHDGNERVALENRRRRMAKILLWERRNHL
ncbi:MAG: hypothetical protein II049_05400 [Clostridia bacterium]|nr:hypothetical protein [Clostridia bacterium]